MPYASGDERCWPFLKYVTDKCSGTHFLIVTGADVCVVPPSHMDRCHHQDFSLQAVNITPIPTYEIRSLTLKLGIRRNFHWGFIIADIKRSIIGSDFLHHFNLLVEMTNHKFLDDLTNLRVEEICSLDVSPSPALSFPRLDNEFMAILHDFSSVAWVSTLDHAVQHSVTHHIQTQDHLSQLTHILVTGKAQSSSTRI